jgi:hypothetical protein
MEVVREASSGGEGTLVVHMWVIYIQGSDVILLVGRSLGS